MKNSIPAVLATVVVLALPAKADVVSPPQQSASEIAAMCPFMEVDQQDPELLSYDGAHAGTDEPAIKKGFDAFQSEALKDAYDIWTPLAAGENAAAQYHLGLLFYGDGETDGALTCALTWFQAAAAKGHLGATTNIGVLRSSGDHELIDHAEASQLLEYAAARCHLDAQFQYGSFLARIPKPHRDFVEAHKWLMIADTRGHIEAKKSNRILRRFTSVAELREGNRRHKEWLAAHSCRH